LKANPGVEILLSDIRMPLINGYTLPALCIAVRPELKILLMTGYEQPPPPELMRAREIRTLRKPVNCMHLSELVGGMLARP